MMTDALYAAVRLRARFRCEYCRLPEAPSEVTFPVDHVIARQHRGATHPDNLALACPGCNTHKGTNLATVEWPSQDLIRLYHPRRDVWGEHFRLKVAVVEGITEIGRATARLLEMNAERRVAMREWLMQEGLF